MRLFCVRFGIGKWKETERFEIMCVEIPTKFSFTTEYHWYNIHADFPMRYSETQKRSCSCLYLFIIDLFIVLSFPCVIEFSLKEKAFKSIQKRSEFSMKVSRDKKRKVVSRDNL